MNTLFNRRDFLKLSAGATTVSLSTMMLPAQALADLPENLRWDRTMVLLRLDGGNDVLNTIVPYNDPLYYEYRPKIGLTEFAWKDSVFGFHPRLSPLLPSWNSGKGDMGLILGTGYPNAVESHFLISDVLAAAVPGEAPPTEGWASNFMNQVTRPAGVGDAIMVGHFPTGPLRGNNMRVIVSSGEEGLTLETHDTDDLERISHPYKVLYGIQEQVNAATAVLGNVPDAAGVYPATTLGAALREAANLIIYMQTTQGVVNIPVITINQGGYDTHNNQLYRHDLLISELAGALAAFRDDMIHNGIWNKVMLMTYSDFGRSAFENSVGGTDHGQAGMQLVMGGNVSGGYFSNKPLNTVFDLSEVENFQGLNAPDFSMDFRHVFASAMVGWFGAPQAISDAVFSRGDQGNVSFAPLPLFKG